MRLPSQALPLLSTAFVCACPPKHCLHYLLPATGELALPSVALQLLPAMGALALPSIASTFTSYGCLPSQAVPTLSTSYGCACPHLLIFTICLVIASPLHFTPLSWFFPPSIFTSDSFTSLFTLSFSLFSLRFVLFSSLFPVFSLCWFFCLLGLVLPLAAVSWF